MRKKSSVSLITGLSILLLAGCGTDTSQQNFPKESSIIQSVSKGKIQYVSEKTKYKSDIKTRKNLIPYNSSKPNSNVSKNYTEVAKPEYVFSVGVYPQDTDKMFRLIKQFMADHVTTEDIKKFELGGWTAPDEAVVTVKFYGIKDLKLFNEKIVPDLKYYLNDNM